MKGICRNQKYSLLSDPKAPLNARGSHTLSRYARHYGSDTAGQGKVEPGNTKLLPKPTATGSPVAATAAICPPQEPWQSISVMLIQASLPLGTVWIVLSNQPASHSARYVSAPLVFLIDDLYSTAT